MNKFSEDKYISKQIVKRLPRYYRFLGELKDKGVERISSTDLSTIMNVTASQIRQDLNKFGGLMSIRFIKRSVVFSVSILLTTWS